MKEIVIEVLVPEAAIILSNLGLLQVILGCFWNHCFGCSERGRHCLPTLEKEEQLEYYVVVLLGKRDW